MNNLDAGVDFSTGELSLAVAEKSGSVLFESHLKLQGRDSANMLPWISGELEKYSFKFDDINRWTCGAGPGSFTGLRIIAALISGLTFSDSRDTAPQVRGVPSAIALAAEAVTLKQNIDSIGILYDGRRGELLSYNVTKTDKALLPMNNGDELPVISAEDQSVLDSHDLIVGLTSEKDALKNVLTDKNFGKIVFIDAFPVVHLLAADSICFPWNRESLMNPVYLRPPVHVKPSPVRKVVIG